VSQEQPTGQRPRVVIVGAGFGGLQAAKVLANESVEITVIDRNNYHCFLPLLYQVATAGLEPEAIAQPVRRILRAPNVRFMMAEVTGIDLERRCVRINVGAADGKSAHEDVPYDYLIVAAGSVTNFFGMTSVEEAAYGVKDLPEAVELRDRILRSFERAEQAAPEDRTRLMTTIVVGGGPTGVELAGALAELQRHVLRRDFPRLDLTQGRVLLLEATDKVLPTLPDSLRRKAERQMRDLGVEVSTGAAVASADEEGVTLRDGERIAAGTVIWVAGVRASPLADMLGGGGPAGRVAVRPTLQTAARDEAYVVGDMAFVTEQGGHPAIAPVAIAQGETAAKNVLRAIAGQAQRPIDFTARDMLVTIGRSRGVAVVRGLRFSGLIAWVLWLFVHLLKLVGLRNRLVVLTNWVWNYFTYDRGVRIITGRGPDSRRERTPPSV